MKDKEIKYFFCFTIIIILYFLYKKYYNYIFTVRVKSTIDNKYYRVKNTFNKQDAANILATISKRIDILVENLKKENNGDANVTLFLKRYNNNNYIENLDVYSTSYTINKGEEIALCISSKVDNSYHNINLLMFVTLHELAHIGCKTNGHNKEFIKFFNFLLKKSIKYKIYNYEDYSSKPIEYCGITIDNSPI